MRFFSRIIKICYFPVVWSLCTIRAVIQLFTWFFSHCQLAESHCIAAVCYQVMLLSLWLSLCRFVYQQHIHWVKHRTSIIYDRIYFALQLNKKYITARKVTMLVIFHDEYNYKIFYAVTHLMGIIFWSTAWSNDLGQEVTRILEPDILLRYPQVPPL
jgi:hypothetical protein